jgi:hypothetical protein
MYIMGKCTRALTFQELVPGKYATGLSTKGGFMNFDDKVKSLGTGLIPNYNKLNITNPKLQIDRFARYMLSLDDHVHICQHTHFPPTGGDDKASTGDCAAAIPGVDGGGLDTEDVQPLANVKILKV